MKMMKFDATWEQTARQPGCGGLLKRFLKHHLAAALKLMLMNASAVALVACSTDASMLVGATNDVLEAMGLKSPNVPDAQEPPREVPLKMTADSNLNTANDRRPVAAVARPYSLKDLTSFLQASYDTFIDPAREKQTLGADLVNVCGMMLVPGQCYDFTEKVLREVITLGVVALFRSPASQRWKFAFNTEEDEKSGTVIGLYACAMTVTFGALTTPAGAIPLIDLNLLSPVVCGS